MTAWCSGAPGVALALASCVHSLAARQNRLPQAPITHEEQMHLLQAPLDLAMQTTLQHLAGEHADPRHPRSFCLCHGIAGNADILLQLTPRHASDPVTRLVIDAAERGMRDHHDAGDWPCGIRDGGQSPGLLLGLAGIGHFYLRLHDPALRSVLHAGREFSPRSLNQS
jgi:lantibiotic modifying enzyme